MLNKLLVLLALILFGGAMYIAGLSSPESVKTEFETWQSNPATEESSN